LSPFPPSLLLTGLENATSMQPVFPFLGFSFFFSSRRANWLRPSFFSLFSLRRRSIRSAPPLLPSPLLLFPSQAGCTFFFLPLRTKKRVYISSESLYFSSSSLLLFLEEVANSLFFPPLFPKNGVDDIVSPSGRFFSPFPFPLAVGRGSRRLFLHKADITFPDFFFFPSK